MYPSTTNSTHLITSSEPNYHVTLGIRNTENKVRIQVIDASYQRRSSSSITSSHIYQVTRELKANHFFDETGLFHEPVFRAEIRSILGELQSKKSN